MQKELKPNSAQQIGEIGDISPIEKLAVDLNKEGIFCIGLSAGGTLGMVSRMNPKTRQIEWVSRLPGAFDADAYHRFNTRRERFNSKKLHLDDIERPAPNPAHYHKLISRKNGRALSPLVLSGMTFENIAKEERLYESIIYPQPLRSGRHSLLSLAADRKGSLHYADLLLKELVSGRYPKGIRLDSTYFVDERSFATFSAINCGVVFPRILQAAEELTGGVTRTERGMSLADREKIIQALSKIIVFISMGSDQKKIANSFYNQLAYLTGLTFITVSANSAHGIEGGDAEINLGDVSQVAKAIHEGKLPRGVAYDVGDGLVSAEIEEKMKPAASGIEKPTLGADGKYYAATFQAFYSVPVSELPNSKWFFDQVPPQISDLLFYLSFIPIPTDHDSFDLNDSGYNASELADTLTSVAITNIDSIPDKFPIGTKFIVVEAPARANGPPYEVLTLRKAINQLEARTDGTVKPVIIVTSENPFSYVTQDYEAAIITQLKSFKNYSGRVVSGKSLSAEDVRFLISLRLMKTKSLADFGFPEAKKELARLNGQQIQDWIDDYIQARKLPDVEYSVS